MYTRMLLRAAILIGGTGACLALAGPAAADDTPQLGDGLLRTIVEDTVGGVVDVLTPPPESKRPVKTAVKKTVKVVDTTVDAAVTTLTQPPSPTDGSSPKPTATTTVGGNDDGSKPATKPKPTPTIDTVEPPGADQPPPAHGATRPVEIAGTTIRQTHPTARTAVNRHASPRLNPDSPAPPPGPPGHVTDRDTISPAAPTGNGDATPAPHPAPPATTSIQVPGRDQAADGRTRRPDPPSG